VISERVFTTEIGSLVKNLDQSPTKLRHGDKTGMFSGRNNSKEICHQNRTILFTIKFSYLIIQQILLIQKNPFLYERYHDMNQLKTRMLQIHSNFLQANLDEFQFLFKNHEPWNAIDGKLHIFNKKLNWLLNWSNIFPFLNLGNFLSWKFINHGNSKWIIFFLSNFVLFLFF